VLSDQSGYRLHQWRESVSNRLTKGGAAGSSLNSSDPGFRWLLEAQATV